MPGPKTYIMAEARAQHEPSGLWHYVRGYGVDELTAALGVTAEALRKNWVLDQGSLRFQTSTKGEWY